MLAGCLVQGSRRYNGNPQCARFVGPEVLQGVRNRYVDHWRGGIVVGQKDPSQWWQGLQFGFQNLYDPQLDEWFTMTTFSHRPGPVTLPPTCPPPGP
jgi:hypothetical protein